MSWPLVALKDCCTIVGGATPKREVEAYWDNQDIPWVTPKDISKIQSIYFDDAPEYISQKGFDSCAAHKLPKGSLLLTSRAPIGNVAITTRELCTNQGFKSLVPKENIDIKYLYFCMLYSADRLENEGNGATFKEVSKKVVEAFKIPLPPLETQKQIAAVLEKADQLRKDCQQMEQELNNLAQSVFIDMFGDPVTNPKGWDVIPCKTLCEKITVGVVVQPASYYVDNGVPALRSLNVRENKLSEDKMMYFSKEAHTKQLAKSQIFEGDVLIVRSGQPGRAAVVTKKFDNCNCIDVLIARPNASVLESQYLSFFLNSEGGRKLVLKEERGQVQKHLNVKVLNEALIPCPPIETQRQFIDVYNILLEELNNTLLLIKSQDGLFNALMQKAFKGELKL